MSEQHDANERAGVTGDVIFTARFDPAIARHGKIVGFLFMIVTVVGIPFIPFAWLLSRWYFPVYLQRISARLTTQAVEVRKGVFFRTEATIPLNRITDVRLHDGPIMRYCGIRGLKVETAGQSGEASGSEGDLVGVIDAAEMRDAILRQRQIVLGADQGGEPPASAGGNAGTLTEIRDILARIEAKLHPIQAG